MKIRITKLPLTKYQTKGQVDENDAWIRKILEFEFLKGSGQGTGLPNWGYNSRIPLKADGTLQNPINPATGKAWTIDDAMGFFKQDILPKVSQYPMGMRERMADYIYNTGRNPNDLLLYNAGKITLDQLNSPKVFTNEWNQYGSDVQKLFSDPAFINKLDQSRDDVYRTTKQVNGKPNPAYPLSWQYRLKMFDPYVLPAASQQPAAATNVAQPAAVVQTTGQPTASSVMTGSNNAVDSDPFGTGMVDDGYGNPLGVQKFNANPQLSALPNPDCPAGQTYNPILGKCVTREEQDGMDKALAGFGDYLKRKKAGLPTNSFKTTGNEGTASNPMRPEQSGTPAATGTGSGTNQSGKKKTFNDVFGPTSPFWMGVNIVSPFVRGLRNRAMIRDAREKSELARYNSMAAVPNFRGNFTVNEGLFRPDDRGVNEGMFTNTFFSPMMMGKFGGAILNDSTIDNNMRIRIKGVPTMKYGGQSNLGLDLGRRKVYTDMPESSSESITNSMTELKDGNYVLEAEKDETILRPDGTHFNIGGEKHYNNGTKLVGEQAPPGSFIFSEKLKAPKQALPMFGITNPKAKKMSYADIAKRFPLNQYKAGLEDPTKQDDVYETNTNRLMHNKNSQKLALLAAIQESSKGMPMPSISESILGVPEMAYGGYYMPKFQGTTGSSTVKGDLGEWSDDFQTLQKLLLDPKNAELRKSMYQNFLQDYKNSPLKNDPKGQEKFIQNFLEAQRQFMGIRAAYKDKPEELTTEDWDTGGKNTRYKQKATEQGFTPLTDQEIRRFQGGYRALAKATRDPKFFESFGKYFKLSPVGVKDEEYLGMPISKDDEWVGNTTLGQIAQLRMPYEEPEKKPDPQWICDANGQIVPVASGGYSSREEAAKHCPEKKPPKPKYICVNNQLKTTMSGVGYDSPEEAMKHCGTPGKEIPFEFLTPDKLNLAVKANALTPNIYLPEMYQLSRRSAPIAFDDWMARVQNRQSTYNTAMDTAARTNQSQAVGSFLAGLVGAQDVSDIADVNSRNLDRAERRAMADMEMDFKTDLFNLGERKEYNRGVDIARQQYDNAKNMRANEFVQAYADAWENRGDLYDINTRNPFFYRDPRSYKTIFKGPVGGFGALGSYGSGSTGFGTNGAGGLENIGATANNLYTNYYESMAGIPDAKREELATFLTKNALNASRQTNTQSFDAFGFPRSSFRRTSRMTNPDPDDE